MWSQEGSESLPEAEPKTCKFHYSGTEDLTKEYCNLEHHVEELWYLVLDLITFTKPISPHPFPKFPNTFLSHVTHFRRTGLADFLTEDDDGDDDDHSGNTAVLGARVRGWTSLDFLRAQCPQHTGGRANVSSLDDISGWREPKYSIRIFKLQNDCFGTAGPHIQRCCDQIQSEIIPCSVIAGFRHELLVTLRTFLSSPSF